MFCLVPKPSPAGSENFQNNTKFVGIPVESGPSLAQLQHTLGTCTIVAAKHQFLVDSKSHGETRRRRWLRTQRTRAGMIR